MIFRGSVHEQFILSDSSNVVQKNQFSLGVVTSLKENVLHV